MRNSQRQKRSYSADCIPGQPGHPENDDEIAEECILAEQDGRNQTAVQHKSKHFIDCVFTGSAQSASICQAPEAAVFAGGKLCRGPVLLARTRCV